jgi:hypothetical protein
VYYIFGKYAITRLGPADTGEKHLVLCRDWGRFSGNDFVKTGGLTNARYFLTGTARKLPEWKCPPDSRRLRFFFSICFIAGRLFRDIWSGLLPPAPFLSMLNP